MGAEDGAHTFSAQAWRRIGRQALRQAAQLALTLAVLALTAVTLGAIAAGLQAGRDEARNADLVLVVTPAVPPAGMVEHSFELYRRGYIRTFVIAGEGAAAVRAQLTEQGVPLAGIVEAPEAVTTGELRRLAREARAKLGVSALVVSTPEEQLRTLKIARDQGLRAYGAPLPEATIEPLSLVGASIRYWRYVLFGL